MRYPLQFCLVASFFALAVSSAGGVGPTYYTTKGPFVAATNPAVIEDFESLPAEQILPSLSRPVGTFTPYAGDPYSNVYINLANYTNFGLPGPIGTQVITANGDEDFELFLAAPTNNIGFDTYLNQFGPATIRLYTSGHALLDTYTHEHDSTQVGFFGVISDLPLTSIRWTTTVGRAINTGIDNILIGTACRGDLNHDGFVDDADFSLFAVAYDVLDCADPVMPAGCPADLNADGVVDDTDFTIFAAAYDRLFCE